MSIENRPMGFALPSETGNSRLRQIVSPVTEKVVVGLHKAFPGLTADHLTYIGTAGITLGSYLAWKRQYQELHQQKPTISTAGVLVVIAASSAMDLLDGSMARLQNMENPGSIDTGKGQIVDVVSDRIQEFIMGGTRIIMAAESHDSIRETAAWLNTITNPWPSLARAKMETKGIKVQESGKGLGILGTRMGRTILNTAALVFPETHHIPVQTISDAVGTVLNLKTTVERLRTKPQSELLSREVRQKAVKRQKALEIVTGAIVGASLIYLATSKSKKYLSKQ